MTSSPKENNFVSGENRALLADGKIQNTDSEKQRTKPDLDRRKSSSSSIENDSITPPDAELQRSSYSATRVKIIVSLISFLYNTSYAIEPVISQYLIDRWSEEAGHNRTIHPNSRSACDKNISDPVVKAEDKILERVSVTIMYYTYASSFPAILSVLVLGPLSDLVGRRPAVISSLLGATAKCVLVVIIIHFRLHPNLLFVAYAMDGIGGSYYVNLLSIFSVAADVNPQQSTRILWITILNTLGYVALAAVSTGIGYLIKYAGYFPAAVTLLAPLGLSVILAVIFLPETLPVSIHQRSWRKLGKYMASMLFIYTRDGSKRTRWALTIAMLIFFISMLNALNITTTDTLYQRYKPFCWDSTQIGYYSAFRNGAQYFCGTIFLKVHQSIGCARDEVMAMVGMLFQAGSFVVEAFVTTTWQMYMVPIISIPSVNVSAIIRGVMSMLAGPQKQGALFSSIAVVEAVCNMAASTSYNKVYAATVTTMPGAVYLVMAGVAVLTFLIFIPFFLVYDGLSKTYGRLMEDEDSESTPSIKDGSMP